MTDTPIDQEPANRDDDAVDPRLEISPGKYRLITAAVVVVALLIGAVGVSLIARYVEARRSGVTKPAPFVPTVRTTTIELQDVPVFVEGTGFMESPATVRVPVETTGKLLRLHKREGEAVAVGDTIAEVDDQVWKRRVEAAEAREVSLKASLEYVASELSREEKLAESGSGRLADRDRWLSERRRLDASLLENGASLAEAKMFLEKCKIVSTRAGVWYDEIAKEGEYLQAGQPLGLLRVVDRLELEVEVPGYARLALSVGEEVDVELLDVDPTLTDVAPRIEACTILRLPSGASAVSRRFPVIVGVPNAEQRLFPGLFARVRFELPRTDSILLVPKECVFDYYGRRALYVVEPASDGKSHARLRYVDLRSAPDDPGHWVVLTGLAAGEVVVLSPIEQLTPDIEVQAEERS